MNHDLINFILNNNYILNNKLMRGFKRLREDLAKARKERESKQITKSEEELEERCKDASRKSKIHTKKFKKD